MIAFDFDEHKFLKTEERAIEYQICILVSSFRT